MPASSRAFFLIAPPLSSLCAARKAGAGGLSTAFLKIVRREEKVGSPPYCTYLAWSVQFFRIIYLPKSGFSENISDQAGAEPCPAKNLLPEADASGYHRTPFA